ncbi:Folylpolyglutamate synthetase family protein [Striga hermonthica]|uniref:Folylpolyglutamate synthetase family protein n=1 Tax=Striga hermonthica TaxID=68872 RepID=A0A9N7NB95_STRHE|nr:Folylpolyglutamate synthetase family protein [Striga hermonthica]
MKIPSIVRSLYAPPLHLRKNSHFVKCRPFLDALLRPFSTALSESEGLKEFTEYMDNLKNYERIGVPRGAGTDSGGGFDLGRMGRLLHCLGNPQTKFKAFHIAGTKGKGSTAAFLSSILRSEGYYVGCYTSPHIRTIRERILLGRDGEPVSVKALSSHFHKIKEDLEAAVRHEKGHLSHFEVFTALAFSLFAEEKVQFVVIEAGLGGARDATNVLTCSELVVSVITNIGAEHLAALGGSLESVAVAKSGIIKERRPLILGGPFLPHIERIIRDKALSMSAPVVSTSDPGNRSVIKGFCRAHEMPRQLCDILLLIERDIHMFIELFDVRLRMLGSHQLQNASTATCAALFLRDQGWNLSDASIHAGLESAILLGRSQFLTYKEAKMLGLPGANILLDGAHTKESAQALMNMIKMAFPDMRLVLVVAMANDKDHLGFAREILSAGCLEALCFTEVDIAGDRSRTTSSTLLKDLCVQACQETGIDFIDCQTSKHEPAEAQHSRCARKNGNRPILFVENSLMGSLRFGNKILAAKTGSQHGMIVVTGSLHIVSAVLEPHPASQPIDQPISPLTTCTRVRRTPNGVMPEKNGTARKPSNRTKLYRDRKTDADEFQHTAATSEVRDYRGGAVSNATTDRRRTATEEGDAN